MRNFSPLCLLAGALLLCGQAGAQGLLGIGQSADYSEKVPFTIGARLSGGYDSIDYKQPTAQTPNFDSYFVEGAVGLKYADVSLPTQWKVAADFGLLHYTDSVPGGKDLYYNTHAAFNIAHSFDTRLKVSDNLYASYEMDPDYGVGASTGQFAGQYFYGYNNFNVAYAWTERFTTNTSYTIDTIHYQDQDVAPIEDHLEQILSQQFAYELSRTTKLSVEYRFGLVRYTDTNASDGTTSPNYMSHYLLVGVEQAWSPRLTMTLKGGAQFYESDRGNRIAPYSEGSLDYKLSKRTNVRAYYQLGFDPTDLGEFDANYAFHAGIVANYKITEKLTANAGVHYVYSDFIGSGNVTSYHENEIDATVGLSYSILRNLSVDANYSHTTIASDVESVEYSRNRVNLGLNASF